MGVVSSAMFEAFAPWVSLGSAALFVQERRSQSSWQIVYRR